MKKLELASAIIMALGVTAANAGSVVNINPDAGGVDPAIAVGALGWDNGNAISVPRTNVVGSTFQTYAHASLANFLSPAGTSIGGLNLNAAGANGYEWTMVTGFQEEVTAHTGTIPNDQAAFKVTSGGTNFFQIYFDTARNADNLTGKGFNDGTLILSGTVKPFDVATGFGASSFNTTGGCTVSPAGALTCGNLDQFISDNYPNIDSLAGNGSSLLQVDVASVNSAFFLGGFTTLLLDFNTFQNLPYGQQNPSSCFWDGTQYISGAGPITGGTAAQTAAQCATNTVGSINGVDGANVMFQTRATTSFQAVPEPASLALLGIGLTGLALARRRKARA